MMVDTIIKLVETFVPLSLIAFGGGNTVLPEMHEKSVNLYHWLSSADFAAVFSIARAAPGPSAISTVTLIGFGAAGWLGALVATLAMLVPSSLLCVLCVEYFLRAGETRMRWAIARGLSAVALGLVFASALTIARAADHNWEAYLVTAVATVLLYFTSINPVYIIAAGGVLGFFKLV